MTFYTHSCRKGKIVLVKVLKDKANLAYFLDDRYLSSEDSTFIDKVHEELEEFDNSKKQLDSTGTDRQEKTSPLYQPPMMRGRGRARQRNNNSPSTIQDPGGLHEDRLNDKVDQIPHITQSFVPAGSSSKERYSRTSIKSTSNDNTQSDHDSSSHFARDTMKPESLDRWRHDKFEEPFLDSPPHIDTSRTTRLSDEPSDRWKHDMFETGIPNLSHNFVPASSAKKENVPVMSSNNLLDDPSRSVNRSSPTNINTDKPKARERPRTKNKRPDMQVYVPRARRSQGSNMNNSSPGDSATRSTDNSSVCASKSHRTTSQTFPTTHHQNEKTYHDLSSPVNKDRNPDRMNKKQKILDRRKSNEDDTILDMEVPQDVDSVVLVDSVSDSSTVGLIIDRRHSFEQDKDIKQQDSAQTNTSVSNSSPVGLTNDDMYSSDQNENMVLEDSAQSDLVQIDSNVFSYSASAEVSENMASQELENVILSESDKNVSENIPCIIPKKDSNSELSHKNKNGSELIALQSKMITTDSSMNEQISDLADNDKDHSEIKNDSKSDTTTSCEESKQSTCDVKLNDLNDFNKTEAIPMETSETFSKTTSNKTDVNVSVENVYTEGEDKKLISCNVAEDVVMERPVIIKHVSEEGNVLQNENIDSDKNEAEVISKDVSSSLTNIHEFIENKCGNIEHYSIDLECPTQDTNREREAYESSNPSEIDTQDVKSHSSDVPKDIRDNISNIYRIQDQSKNNTQDLANQPSESTDSPVDVSEKEMFINEKLIQDHSEDDKQDLGNQPAESTDTLTDVREKEMVVYTNADDKDIEVKAELIQDQNKDDEPATACQSTKSVNVPTDIRESKMVIDAEADDTNNELAVETPDIVKAVDEGGDNNESEIEEEDTWDSMFNEDGDCLDPTAMEVLTKTVGKVKIQKAKKINYLDYKPVDKGTMDLSEYGHIIEIYDFPAEFVTRDLITAFQAFLSRGFDLKWVDDTHALGIFSSAIAAQDAAGLSHPLIKVRPLSQASQQSRSKAKRCAEFLQPYKPRPETSASAARRLVAGALGIATNVSKEKRERERKQLKEAKEKRRKDRQNRDDIWEYGKCAMDEET